MESDISGLRSSRLAMEAVVIVGSILLAFAIDAAWERHRDSEARVQLVKSLILDFETTQLRLRDSIDFGQGILDSNEELLLIVSTQKQIDAAQFGELVSSFFRGISFEPALSAYQSAVGQNGLGAIQSVEFSQAVATFFNSKNFYDFHARVAGELFYQGPALKIRRELGSLGILWGSAELCQGYNCTFPDHFAKDVGELMALVSRPDIYADLENANNVNSALVYSLRNMEAATEKAIIALQSID